MTLSISEDRIQLEGQRYETAWWLMAGVPLSLPATPESAARILTALESTGPNDGTAVGVTFATPADAEAFEALRGKPCFRCGRTAVAAWRGLALCGRCHDVYADRAKANRPSEMATALRAATVCPECGKSQMQAVTSTRWHGSGRDGDHHGQPVATETFDAERHCGCARERRAA